MNITSFKEKSKGGINEQKSEILKLIGSLGIELHKFSNDC